jgi:hypothetical protein
MLYLTSAVLLFLLATEERKKKGGCGALVINGQISNPRYQLRPLPEGPSLVMNSSPVSAQAVTRGAAARCCASQVVDGDTQAHTRGAAQVLDRCA